jgi:hypothetical protein
VGTRQRRSERAAEPDPFAVLGLANDATLEQIENARRLLAKTAHPDVGGSVDEMQGINAAADQAAMIVAIRRAAAPVTSPAPPSSAPSGPQFTRQFHWRADHPSFTIEALPAEAFEALLVVSSWLGEAIDDDPPYRLDVELTDPSPVWCRLELVPDAGATTVSITVGSESGVTGQEVDSVRDAWIASLNSLDWAEIGDSLPRP